MSSPASTMTVSMPAQVKVRQGPGLPTQSVPDGVFGM